MKRIGIVLIALGFLYNVMSQEINEIIQPGYIIQLDSTKFAADSICTTKTLGGSILICNAIKVRAKCDTGYVVEINPRYNADSVWTIQPLFPSDWTPILFRRIRMRNTTAPLDSIECSSYRRVQ